MNNTINITHAKQHSIQDTLNHTSSATPETILKANASGLPVNSAIVQNGTNIGINTALASQKLEVVGAAAIGDTSGSAKVSDSATPLINKYIGVTVDSTDCYILLCKAADFSTVTGVDGIFTMHRGTVAAGNAGASVDISIKAAYDSYKINKFNASSSYAAFDLVTLTYSAVSYVALRITSDLSQAVYFSGRYWGTSPNIVTSGITSVTSIRQPNISSDANGNVGIGVAAPLQKLQVSGTIANTYSVANDITVALAVNSTNAYLVATKYTTGSFVPLNLQTSDLDRLTILVDGSVTINESGASIDVRIEGDTDVNLLVTDGSADKVGIGTAAPTEKLEVVGSIKSTGLNAYGTIELGTPPTVSSIASLQAVYEKSLGAAGDVQYIILAGAYRNNEDGFSGKIELISENRVRVIEICFYKNLQDGVTPVLHLSKFNAFADIGVNLVNLFWNGSSYYALRIIITNCSVVYTGKSWVAPPRVAPAADVWGVVHVANPVIHEASPHTYIGAGHSVGFQIANTVIKRATRASSGLSTVANTSIEGIIIPPKKYLADNVAAGLFEVALPTSGDTCSGSFDYAIHCWSGTDFQILAGICNYTAGNKAGTVTSVIGHTAVGSGIETEMVTAGTCTDTLTITNGTGKITVNLTSNTSLTPLEDRFYVVYTLHNNSYSAVTIL